MNSILPWKKGELHRNFQVTDQTHTGQVYALALQGLLSYMQLHSEYRDISLYIGNISKGIFSVERGVILDERSQMIRDVITGIMCNCRLDINSYLHRYDLNYENFKIITGFNEEYLKDYIDDGLVNFDNLIISVVGEGRPILRNIASLFDPELRSGSIIILRPFKKDHMEKTAINNRSRYNGAIVGIQT
jgi:oxygen-independent coproporphyrinogen-3 oxidase